MLEAKLCYHMDALGPSPVLCVSAEVTCCGKQPLLAPGSCHPSTCSDASNALVLLHTLCFYQQDPGQRSDSAGDLAGDMEPLAVRAPEGAEDATASSAEVEGGDKAAARGEVESPKGAGPGGKGPQGAAAIVEETWEYPEAEVAAACARAAERIAVSQAAKVLQSAIAEVDTPQPQVPPSASFPCPGSPIPSGLGGCSSSTFSLWGEIFNVEKLKAIKRKKSLKFLLRVCALFPSGFPLSFR